MASLLKLSSIIVFAFFCATVNAASKVIGTGGATNIEGAAGGGLVPWAVNQRLRELRPMVNHRLSSSSRC